MKLNWQVGDDLGLRLDQVSDEETQDLETVERMLAEINQVVAGYGFKIRAVNRWPDFRRSAVDEEAYVDQRQEDISMSLPKRPGSGAAAIEGVSDD